jgi:HK97 family phage portal protein
MGVLSNFIENRSQTSIIKNLLSGGSPSHSGVSVTPDSAMRTSAVWACHRVLSTAMGALPLHVYEDKPDGGKRKAIENPVYNLLHREPNPEISAFTYRQMKMVNLCSYGNFYSEIQFDDRGFPVAIWPIPAQNCEPARTKNKELFYQIDVNGEKRNLPAYRILHFMGMGKDGMKGMSPIREMAETIGVSIAAERFGGSFFGGGANVGAIVDHPGHLTAEGSTKLENSLNRNYTGLGNAHRIMLLEEGMKYQKVGIPPNEAQFLETRQFQIEDIARIYGVQLHKIGHLLHATFSNIEHQAIEFVTDTMLPWTVNCEMEYDRKLFGNTGLYTKHSLEGLLRGDTAARSAFYTALFYLSSITPNEIRDKEDMNPLPDGNRTFVQSNLIPSDKIDQYIAKNNGSQPARNLSDAVKRIVDRNKENLLRQYKTNPEKFLDWLESYSRDFPAYMIKELLETDK